MTQGIDTAKFQGVGVPGDFEIINAEDPTLPDKVAWNVANGRRWGVYIWIYAGTDVRAFTAYWITHIRNAFGEPPDGWWADYEENAVSQGDLDGFFYGCMEQGAYPHSGKYSNEWRLPSNDWPDRPFWYAGYPDPNDGIWRNYQVRANRPVHIWQWSSGGGLDRDVIIDDAWYATWNGSAPAPAPKTGPKTGDGMEILVSPNGCVRVQGNVVMQEFDGPRSYGIPNTVADYMNGAYGNKDTPIRSVADIEIVVLRAVSENLVHPQHTINNGPTGLDPAKVQKALADLGANLQTAVLAAASALTA